MPSYENMMITVTLLLFFTNAMFVFFGGLPGYNGQNTVQLGISQDHLSDLNSSLNNIIDSNVFQAGTQDINTALSASSSPKGYLTLFQNWLFGALNTATLGLSGQIISGVSLIGTMITIFGSMFFGYLYWVDFFLNPNWGFSIGVIGTAVKVFLFIVQVLGIFDIIFRIFWVGTGVRG